MTTERFIGVLHEEMDWLQQVINQVICSYLLQEGHEKHWTEIEPPDAADTTIPYYGKLHEWNLDLHSRLCLALILAPEVRPEILDIFFSKNALHDRGFTEFGGVVGKIHSGFLPTGQTLKFMIASGNPAHTIDVVRIINANSMLVKEQVLELAQTEHHESIWNVIISLNSRWFHYFMTGEMPLLEQSTTFPAQQITTTMNWDDLVLNDEVMDEVMEIDAWLTHGNTLMHDWGLHEKLKPGYRALFYGPPGTGKTLTATLLGKSTHREVYRVDLSMIVSKYIGETEKNLSRIFDVAQHKDWILFFDEADALFGKRTMAVSSNDRHANQQTGYLLQRIEDFPGVVILASNLKENMDDAFTRRFQSMVHFAMPSPHERLLLWEKAFSGKCQIDPEVNLYQIAEEYELSGGAIVNILRYCALAAVRRGVETVEHTELLNGIRREYRKENKTLNAYAK